MTKASTIYSSQRPSIFFLLSYTVFSFSLAGSHPGYSLSSMEKKKKERPSRRIRGKNKKSTLEGTSLDGTHWQTFRILKLLFFDIKTFFNGHFFFPLSFSHCRLSVYVYIHSILLLRERENSRESSWHIMPLVTLYAKRRKKNIYRKRRWSREIFLIVGQIYIYSYGPCCNILNKNKNIMSRSKILIRACSWASLKFIFTFIFYSRFLFFILLGILQLVPTITLIPIEDQMCYERG